ncbi:MAG: cation:proton antiporter [Bacillota bacterium]
MTVSHIITLLFIGYLVFSIDKKQDSFPVPAILVLIGMGLSLVTYFSNIEVTEIIIYNIFIPPLLFISAYQFPIEGFLKNRKLILGLATIGLLLMVLLLGGAIYGIGLLFFSLPLTSALLLASILTPTDPVSVVSIIKQATGDEDLAHTVEGESMLNDGTSVVVFSSLLALYQQPNSVSFATFLLDFFIVFAGGTLIGVIFGWLVVKIIHYSHHPHYQLMLSIVLAYGSFITAEHFGLSGVLAVVASGMMISYAFGQTEKEDHFRSQLDGFWEIVELSLLAVLFLVIGIEVTEYLRWSFVLFSSVVFILTIIIRLIVIYVMTSLLDTHNLQYNLLITWSGLKGSMSVFLILTLHARVNTGPVINNIVGISFMVVLLSLIIQSLTVAPLAKKLLKKP